MITLAVPTTSQIIEKSDKEFISSFAICKSSSIKIARSMRHMCDVCLWTSGFLWNRGGWHESLLKHGPHNAQPHGNSSPDCGWLFAKNRRKLKKKTNDLIVFERNCSNIDNTFRWPNKYYFLLPRNKMLDVKYADTDFISLFWNIYMRFHYTICTRS